MIIVYTILNTMVEVAVAERINEGSREADIGPFICCVVRALVHRQVGSTQWASTVMDLGDMAVKTAVDVDSASVECHGDGETHLGVFQVVTWHLVLGSPVSRLQKNRDQTGPRPPRTGNSQDRQRPQPRSGLRSLRILEISRPRKDRSNRSQPVFAV